MHIGQAFDRVRTARKARGGAVRATARRFPPLMHTAHFAAAFPGDPSSYPAVPVVLQAQETLPDCVQEHASPRLLLGEGRAHGGEGGLHPAGSCSASGLKGRLELARTCRVGRSEGPFLLPRLSSALISAQHSLRELQGHRNSNQKCQGEWRKAL